MELLEEIKKLQDTDIKNKAKQRLEEFSSFKNKKEKEWFSELCFCILTANSRARTAIAIQDEIKPEGFINLTQAEITKIIRKHNHRFHNNKSKYIVEARKYKGIKQIANNYKNKKDARDFIAKNIKGLGYKEASHFLRNTGHFNLAILDRHVINIMIENNMIKEKPKTITKDIYAELENKLEKVAEKLKISQAELDLYLWYMKGGDVLK